MTVLALHLALAVALILPVLALAAALSAGRRLWLPLGMALCGAALLLAGAIGVLAGGPIAQTALVLGQPEFRAQMGLDPLSAFSLLPPGLGLAAIGLWAIAAPRPVSGYLPLVAAGMVVTILAANVWTLLFGLEVMAVAAWAVMATRRGAATASRLFLGIWLVAGLALLVGLLLMAPATGAASFTAIRHAPEVGWCSTVGLALVLLGGGIGAGLAPFHPWLPPTHATAPTEAVALLSAVLPMVALYVLVRVFFDLAGPALSLWWSLPLLLMGAAGALLGMLRANLDPDIMSALAADTIGHMGIISVTLALALAARALDLDGLATLALSAMLLHVLAHSLVKLSLVLGAGSASAAAGSRALADLGGLARRMPLLTLCMLVAAASATGLPPAFGFTPLWMTFQALFGMARSGGIILPVLMAATILLTGMAMALASGAMVRLIGIGFLGRPRGAGAAMAARPGPTAQMALAGLAGILMILGLLPEAALALARPVIASLPGLRGTWRYGLGHTGLGGMEMPAGGASWLPVAITALLAAIIAGSLWFVWRRGRIDVRHAPAWVGGQITPPWLAHGDPATQISAASLAQPVLTHLGGVLLDARESITRITPFQPPTTAYQSRWSDPAERFLFTPLGLMRVACSAWVDRLNQFPLRHKLGLVLATLLFLAGFALWGQG